LVHGSAAGRAVRDRTYRPNHDEVAFNSLRILFGPARDVAPELADTAELQPGAAVWVHRFGDIGLHAGTWQVLGQTPDWQRAVWPMPGFVHKDSLVPGRYTRRDYPGEDPGADPVESRVGQDEIAGLAGDGLAGAGFVEQRLTKLLT
jgi:hypothetical protein